jgi:hypothetical protein
MLKQFLIYGEISGLLIRKALSIPILEFLEKFPTCSKPEKNIMNVWTVKDSK